ncbi:hypothetical protein YT1_3768 [Rhodococcus ruber]|nr:hypothetical protein YT1_3768 [Rhodococcus ruber]
MITTYNDSMRSPFFVQRNERRDTDVRAVARDGAAGLPGQRR